LGLEVERVLSGGLTSKWTYDSAGRPLEHKVGEGKRLQRHKRYQWSVNDTLKNIQCLLTGKVEAFHYDVFGNLVSHLSNTFNTESYFRDEVGNIFAQEDK
jgi:YD repeat-containing protein